MNVFLSPSAQSAFQNSNTETKKSVESLLGSYAQYKNRHSIPGKSTLKTISSTAREALSLPAGTQVFLTK